MRNDGIEFWPSVDPEDDSNGANDEPDESSSDDVRDDIDAIDQTLIDAGHISDTSDPTRLPNDEIRSRIRDRANELNRDELESPEGDQYEIRDFLVTLNIKGAESAADQEIELIWGNLLKNPSLVKDFIYFLTDRNSKNHYCEFPLLPDMKDILEFANDLSGQERLRPRIIRDGVDNLASLALDRGRCLELAMGSSGDVVAEKIRMLGWLAGFPFMRDAYDELKEHHKEMDIDDTSTKSIADTFIFVVCKKLNMLKERSRSQYLTDFKMDREAREFTHDEVVTSMEGISNLLYKTFLTEPPR